MFRACSTSLIERADRVLVRVGLGGGATSDEELERVELEVIFTLDVDEVLGEGEVVAGLSEVGEVPEEEVEAEGTIGAGDGAGAGGGEEKEAITLVISAGAGSPFVSPGLLLADAESILQPTYSSATQSNLRREGGSHDYILIIFIGSLPAL